MEITETEVIEEEQTPEQQEATGRFAAAYVLFTTAGRKINRGVMYGPRKAKEKVQPRWQKAFDKVTMEGMAYILAIFVGYTVAALFVLCILTLNIIFAIVLFEVWAPLGYAWTVFTGVGLAGWFMAFVDSIRQRQEAVMEVTEIFEAAVATAAKASVPFESTWSGMTPPPVRGL